MLRAILIAGNIKSKSVKKLHLGVDDFFDVDYLFMNLKLFLKLHAFSRVQVLDFLLLVILFFAKEQEEHIEVDHALERQESRLHRLIFV